MSYYIITRTIQIQYTRACLYHKAIGRVNKTRPRAGASVAFAPDGADRGAKYLSRRALIPVCN